MKISLKRSILDELVSFPHLPVGPVGPDGLPVGLGLEIKCKLVSKSSISEELVSFPHLPVGPVGPDGLPVGLGLRHDNENEND